MPSKKKRRKISDEQHLAPEIPELIPLLLETSRSVVFPGSTIGVRLKVGKKLARFLARLREAPYMIIQPDAENDSGAPFSVGVFGMVADIQDGDSGAGGATSRHASLKFSGLYRVYVERASKQDGVMMARHRAFTNIDIPEQDRNAEEFQEAIAWLREKFPLMFRFLFAEKSGETNAEHFFQTPLIRDIMDRVRHATADNIAAVVDGIMNMLNSIDVTFSNEDGDQFGIYNESLAVLIEPKVLDRFVICMQIVHVMFGQGARSSGKTATKSDEEMDTLEARFKEMEERIPEEARKEIKRELNRMRHAHPTEASIAQEHAEFLLDLPWGVYTQDPSDLQNVRDILDEDHAELEKIKERILEYLAVRQLNPAAKSRTLCFVGPPGVGKTSLGESIARSLGRKFVSMSLGGMRDEAELRGHRKTYIGAGPGLILEHIKRAESSNPVFMLDEGDKIGKDWHGDPSAALLSILDPKQNIKFFDWYAKVPFDLSRVLFIVTANIVETILPALLDRFEILELPGYTPLQKLNIAKRHLVIRRRKENGYPIVKNGRDPIDISFTDEALLKMIESYANDEAGVRGLEDMIDIPCRKIVTKIQSGDETIRGILEITETDVEKYCGKPRNIEHAIPDILPPGVIPVLAVSSTGGHVFQAEVTSGYHPGGRKLTMTGVRDASQTKDTVNKIEESFKDGFDTLMWVMKIILDDVQTYEKEIGPLLLTGRLTNGAVPKDGPSAGVPLVGAIYGIIMNKSIKPTKETPLLGMTGEITKNMLLVRAVGGIRDKILAAHRFGVRRMIIPKENERDIDDIPPEIREDMDIQLVRTIPEALRIMYPNDARIRQFMESQQRSSS